MKRALLPVSSRLSFRIWREDDLDLAVSLWGDPRVTAFVDRRGAWGREDVAARLRQEIALEARHGVQYWPMFLLPEEGGELAGCAGLRPRFDPARERVFELGFHLRSAFWGRGLATEAANAVVRLAFGDLAPPAVALFAGHHPDNHASARVLAKLGFRHTHDEPYAPTGLLHPSYLLERASFLSRP